MILPTTDRSDELCRDLDLWTTAQQDALRAARLATPAFSAAIEALAGALLAMRGRAEDDTAAGEADWPLKTVVRLCSMGIGADEARSRLAANVGDVRAALEQTPLV